MASQVAKRRRITNTGNHPGREAAAAKIDKLLSVAQGFLTASETETIAFTKSRLDTFSAKQIKTIADASGVQLLHAVLHAGAPKSTPLSSHTFSRQEIFPCTKSEVIYAQVFAGIEDMSDRDAHFTLKPKNVPEAACERVLRHILESSARAEGLLTYDKEAPVVLLWFQRLIAALETCPPLSTSETLSAELHESDGLSVAQGHEFSGDSSSSSYLQPTKQLFEHEGVLQIPDLLSGKVELQITRVDPETNLTYTMGACEVARYLITATELLNKMSQVEKELIAIWYKNGRNNIFKEVRNLLVTRDYLMLCTYNGMTEVQNDEKDAGSTGRHTAPMQDACQGHEAYTNHSNPNSQEHAPTALNPHATPVHSLQHQQLPSSPSSKPSIKSSSQSASSFQEDMPAEKYNGLFKWSKPYRLDGMTTKGDPLGGVRLLLTWLYRGGDLDSLTEEAVEKAICTNQASAKRNAEVHLRWLKIALDAARNEAQTAVAAISARTAQQTKLKASAQDVAAANTTAGVQVSAKQLQPAALRATAVEMTGCETMVEQQKALVTAFLAAAITTAGDLTTSIQTAPAAVTALIAAVNHMTRVETTAEQWEVIARALVQAVLVVSQSENTGLQHIQVSVGLVKVLNTFTGAQATAEQQEKAAKAVAEAATIIKNDQTKDI